MSAKSQKLADKAAEKRHNLTSLGENKFFAPQNWDTNHY